MLGFVHHQYHSYRKDANTNVVIAFRFYHRFHGSVREQMYIWALKNGGGQGTGLVQLTHGNPHTKQSPNYKDED